MKKAALLSTALFISILKLYAQSISVNLIQPTDTFFFKMDATTEEVSSRVNFKLAKGNKFNFGQVTMKAHAIDPFTLPKIYLNNKEMNAGIYFPNLKEDAIFTFKKSSDTGMLKVQTPIGENAAEIHFVFSKSQLVEEDNEIKIVVTEKQKLNDLAITDLKLYLRAPLSNDIIRVSSEFPGGTKGLVRYLERSLNRELPMRNGAPVGKYPVLVNFMVDTEGNIFNLKAENDPGYGTAQEALRVFKQGPKWVPASENGTNVVDQHRQTIVFMVL